MEEDIEIIIKHLDKYERQYVSEEKNKLLKAIENILNRLEQDERVINKAIEYIERNARKCGNGEEWFESSYCCTSLLNILKGNQKEV